MDLRIPMDPRARGVTFGMAGLLMGWAAAQGVDWATPAKAALAIGVSLAVSLLLMAATRNKLPA